MLRSRNPLENLLQTAGEVARLITADRLFSWATRSFSPPQGWLAWALRSEQDPALVQPGGRCDREGVEQVLFIKLSPIECAIDDSGLQSTDGHDCTGRLRLKVRIVPEPAELAAFRDAVLGASHALGRADIERYLQWQARKLLAELAGRHTARELLEPLDAGEVRQLVEGRLGAAFLAGGLAIDGPITAEFGSDAYLDHRRRESDLDRRRQEADARSRIQQALAAAQSQRLNHLIAMLEQMREASRNHGERSLMDLLAAFGPAERGQMYSALWRLAPPEKRTRYVAAVSGQELLLFDPADLQRPARRHRMPESLGPLRSVRADARSLREGNLLIGAATGVHVVNIDTGEAVRSLAASRSVSARIRGGVNAVCAADESVLASHSELGIMAWPRTGGDEDAPRKLLTSLTANAQTVRCLQIVDNAAWVAIDDRIVRFSPERPPPDDRHEPDGSNPTVFSGSRAPLSAFCVTSDAVYAGSADGQILRWSLRNSADVDLLRRATGVPVESIDIVDSGGVEWLIAADGQDALIASVIGDSHACRYETGAARVRRAAAAEDLFVAMNDNRDRLIAWRPDQASAPAGTVVVPYLTGGSIQDLCLVPG